jgi:hypothetical protein
MLIRMKSLSAYLLILFITALVSCGKTYRHYEAKGEFRYYNRLESPIQVEIRQGAIQQYGLYDVRSGDSLVLFTSGETLEMTLQPSGYIPGVLSDTTTVRVFDSLCYTENRKGTFLHNINSYRSYKRGDRDYVFYLDIDSTLAKQAMRCK